MSYFRTRQPAFSESWITGNYRIEQIAYTKFYRLKFDAADDGFDLTGVDDATLFTIPFPFRLHRVVVTHYDSAYNASVVEMEASFKRAVGHVFGMVRQQEMYWTKKQLNSSNFTIDFSDKKMFFEAGTHTHTWTGTATDIIIVSIYIERLI